MKKNFVLLSATLNTNNFANLIKGLKAGMADYNNDGVITGTELGVYLQDKVTQDTGGSQSPNYDKFTNDDGEFIFLYVDTASGIDKVAVNTSNSDEVMNAASDKNPLLTFGTEGVILDSSLIYNEAVPEWFQNIMKSSGVDKKIVESFGGIKVDDLNKGLDALDSGNWMYAFSATHYKSSIFRSFGHVCLLSCSLSFPASGLSAVSTSLPLWS